MVLSTNSGSFPSNSHVSATFSNSCQQTCVNRVSTRQKRIQPAIERYKNRRNASKLVQSHFGSPQLKRLESRIAPLAPRGFDPACCGPATPLQPTRHPTLSDIYIFIKRHIMFNKIYCLTSYHIKAGPEPLENEINKILGVKREDRFSDHFFPIWYKISVRFVFRTCFASAFSVRPRGTCESFRRSARR